MCVCVCVYLCLYHLSISSNIFRWVDGWMWGWVGVEVCIFAQLFFPLFCSISIILFSIILFYFFTILFVPILGTNFLDYLNRIIIKLFLGHLKDLNGHLCLIHKINRHTYKIHIRTQTKTI